MKKEDLELNPKKEVNTVNSTLERYYKAIEKRDDIMDEIDRFNNKFQ